MATRSRVGTALLLGLVVVGGCSDDGDGGGGDGSASPDTADPGVVHIHGLGINPKDGSLYAATHSGVYRIGGDGSATRVSEQRQDTMGFTVLGPDHFAGSGHPDPDDDSLLSEDEPPLLGLIESLDGGRTWEALSLLAESDFHALSFAHERVYGYDATGQRFMVSSDRREWETRSSDVAVIDFAVSPDDPETIVGGNAASALASKDGGRTWRPVAGSPGLVFLDWSSGDGLVGIDAKGRIFVSTDAESFREVGAVEATPAALLVTDTAWYAAVEGGSILKSTDDGATWAAVSP